jgi:beta-mannosidase
MCFGLLAEAQIRQNLTAHWQFKATNQSRWMPAKVPGSVYLDLRNNNQIPDPLLDEHESQVRWVDSTDWEYALQFNTTPAVLQQKNIRLVFDGLDTDADIWLNNQHLGHVQNMFRRWAMDVKKIIRLQNNLLQIRFRSAITVSNELAARYLPVRLPDHPRTHLRKAAYQFGWDWGPTLTGCGIWKPVWLEAFTERSRQEQEEAINERNYRNWVPEIQLNLEKDSIGGRFQFEANGKPVYMKGVNWVPVNLYPGTASKADYRRLLLQVRDANMNMIRVWGGGIYEDDAFYDLCDSLHLYVWQDLMFAGAMVPGNDSFFTNVKAELAYQVNRLRHHPCIVLWCGNNEIDEAWHNWGWQQSFQLHGTDSATVWQDYRRLFEDSIRRWLHTWDPKRSYISTSPRFGWGRNQSYTEGDSHFWGLWWGLQDWEVFRQKTGRFVSEFGMQSMPHPAVWGNDQLTVTDTRIQSHQKASQGNMKLEYYLQRYFMDSTRFHQLNLEQYSYLTQCLQAYILQNALAVQLLAAPRNQGSLIWQLNDVWPSISWSLIDFSGRPKAAWYAVRRMFAENARLTTDPLIPRNWPYPTVQLSIRRLTATDILIEADQPAWFVELYVPGKNITWSDNFFHLRAGEQKRIRLQKGNITAELLQQIRYRVLNQLYHE